MSHRPPRSLRSRRRPAPAIGLCVATAALMTACSPQQTSAAAEPAPSTQSPASSPTTQGGAPTAPAQAPAPGTASKAAPVPTSVRELTSASGVYSAAQAAAGKDVFLLQCSSCHSPGDYTGGQFWASKVGTSVGDLFKYLHENMPQNDPGGLAIDDYLASVAYILQLNSMPPGDKPLVADTAALGRIRIVQPANPPHHLSTGR